MDKVPSWDQYFMEVAKTISIRSKDPQTKVGAVLVDRYRHIVGTGYNGFAPGVEETPELWQRPTKYEHVLHAEENCLIHSSALILYPYREYTLYTTLYPCPECAEFICQKSINRVVYLDPRYYTQEAFNLFMINNVKVERLEET